ncbi:MAG: hypothetical protein A3A73_00650 [Omnitrophica bacterium RIFCSPLOWO2_01_FULL_50_24]|nr:MAG: hypothetical protein A3A73_00650 [Omnitrophica bacterium RIFCSPLOWO2_01_FULL_50_24]
MKKEEARKLAEEHFKTGYELQMHGKLQEAVENYRTSIQIYPTAEAHTFLGWAYSFQGRFEDAILECRKAIRIDPDFGNPYNDIGAYFIEQGKFKQAVRWLKKAVRAKRYDSYCYPHYNLGRVYEHEGDWKKALACFEASVKANPDYSLGVKAVNRLRALFN